MALEKRQLVPPHVPKIENDADTSNFAEVASDDEDDEEEDEEAAARRKKEKPAESFNSKFPTFTVTKAKLAKKEDEDEED